MYQIFLFGFIAFLLISSFLHFLPLPTCTTLAHVLYSIILQIFISNKFITEFHFKPIEPLLLGSWYNTPTFNHCWASNLVRLCTSILKFVIRYHNTVYLWERTIVSLWVRWISEGHVTSVDRMIEPLLLFNTYKGKTCLPITVAM